MKKRILLSGMIAFSFIGAMLMGTSTTFAAVDGTSHYHVMIMTHLCNSSIKNAADFNAMENGKSPISVLGNDVVACPTTGLTADAAVMDTVASPRTTFNFSVMSDSETQTVVSNGVFMPIKACESDLGLDLTNDGLVSTSTCLDISHYELKIPSSSGSSTLLRVVETMAPAGYHFGILRFTPTSIDGNNDSQSLTYIDPQNSEIDLNMVADTDNMVMLHVYQFQNATSGSTTTTLITDNSTSTSHSGMISGTLFNDLDGNDELDATDMGLSGRTVWLHMRDGGVDTALTSAMTDSTGHYKFENLMAGTYFVEEQEISGWVQNTADMEVTLGNGSNEAIVNFANVMFQSNTEMSTEEMLIHDHSLMNADAQ